MTCLTGFDLCRAALAVEGTTAPEQSVLTTLAIMANGEAQCWPGIAGLVTKTKLSERTVQRAVQGLKDAGHINWVDRTGRGRIYVIHPRQSGTPDEPPPVTVTPPEEDPRHSDTSIGVTPVTLTPRHSDTPVTVAATPVTVTPKQPRTTTSTKTTSSTKSAGEPDAFTLPSDIPADEWADFESMRRSIRKPMTDAIRRKAVARLRELQADGYPPGAVLSHSTLNSYQGLFPPKDQRHEPVCSHRGQPSRPGDGFGAALREMSGSTPPHH